MDVKRKDFIFVSEHLIKRFENVTNNKMTKKEVLHLLDKNAPHDLTYIIQELDQKQEFFYSYFISLSNGDSLWLDTTIVGINNKQKKIELAVGFVNERIETESQENNIFPMNEDPYSGLPNLSYGWDIINKKINQSEQINKKFALVKLVISNSPNILNTFGHENANKALREISKKLIQFMYNKGIIFHSYADGWYALFHSVKNIQTITDEMIRIVQDPLIINNEKMHLIANAGITLYPTDGSTTTELMQHTTIASSSAVKLGPGRKKFYTQGKDLKLLKQSLLTSDLFQCIQKNEIYLEYQPKIDAKSLAITGAETLIRWEHPVWGKVPPVEFIPLIKEIGLEEDFTTFVIDQTIRQLRKWEDEGITTPRVSLNISPEMFLIPSLFDYIRKTLKKHKVSSEQLEIELTEDSRLKYNETILQTIDKLQDLGISIALDDMGDGFSSIYDLIKIPFNTVKLDRRAIDDLENSYAQKSIIKALLDICKNLKIKFIVEGVERKEQFDILRELGCDEIQGFYFSPSLSSAEMKKWFQMDYAVPSNQAIERRMERRKFFRVKLPQSLYAEMKILTIQEKEVSLERSTKILVQDIGPNGMMFYSYLHLPINESIVYGFKLELLGVSYSITGKVVWDNEFRKDIFAHGIEFNISESDREKLTSSLFKLSSLLRENPSYTDNSFIEEEPVLYLRKLNINRDSLK